MQFDFTKKQQELLSRFLSEPARPEETFSLEELAGFLFAIACAPELVMPSDWLPLIFNEEDAGYASGEEAEEVLGAIMALYNRINDEVRRPVVSLPSLMGIRKVDMANLEPDAPLGGWARGFGVGHDFLVELWEDYIPDELDEELGFCLMALTFFSSRSLAEAYHKEVEGEAPTRTLQEMAREMLLALPDAVKSYAHMGMAIRTVLQQESTQEPVRSEKVGRNDPCPCGSGKKYKKCCGSGAPTLH